jgi:hypothetical protein
VARCDDEIGVVTMPPIAESDSWLIEIKGYAELQAVVGVAPSEVGALEDALLTLRKLETAVLLELLDARERRR